MKLIDEKDLATLLKRDCKLSALEYAGVEHWEGYNSALNNVQEVLTQNDKDLTKYYIDA